MEMASELGGGDSSVLVSVVETEVFFEVTWAQLDSCRNEEVVELFDGQIMGISIVLIVTS